nr:hypothetical protein [uncultured Acetatifactor sp.]
MTLLSQWYAWMKSHTICRGGEAREPLPIRRGDTRKTDSEYVRGGTYSIFVFVEPLGGM